MSEPVTISARPASEWAAGACGIFAGVSTEDYHAANGLSSTRIKRLDLSPAHTQLPVEFSAAGQAALDLGTLAHGRILEGKSADELGFARKPADYDGRTKAGKDWLAANASRRSVSVEQIAIADAIADAVRSDAVASRLFGAQDFDGHAELSLRATDEDGRLLKARFDYCCDYYVWDLKTCQDASPEKFGRDCDERGYLLQAAHYLHVASRLGLRFRAFRFVAVSVSAPYEVCVCEFGPEHPAWAPVNERLFGLYGEHSRCVRTGEFPKRSWPVLPVSVPRWSSFSSIQ